MHRLISLIWKEWQVLARDPHGLAVLFLMPAVFILVMSVALQDVFAPDGEEMGQVAVADPIPDATAESFLDHLSKRVLLVTVDANDPLARDEVRLQLAADFGERLTALVEDPGENPAPALDRLADPGVDGRSLQVIDSAIQMALGEALSEMEGDGEVADLLTQLDRHAIRGLRPGQADPTTTLSSVQQSVPAWLVFGMFFVVIPLSTVLIGERQEGTLDRLRLMGVGPSILLLAKLPAYFLVNQVQLLAMLAIGFWIVPLAGAEALQPPIHLTALILVASITSLAAITFALLVGVIAKTHMQATTAGGVFNILFAAAGGIMVPRFVMADTMQSVAWLSPMGWALDGFLAAFLREDALSVIWLPLLGLSLFALLCFLLAVGIIARRH
ncbi:ABC-2 type transport system permease protein [Natronospira proteinivora]|uniref:ABC-2 type transport system permease protein n=1 Tax=Natronospira proteinivora TaxID=1807133 RepID=A0ABT1GBS4_9GAMM|nr:ABC transporter permease [Natronospira proteinivora]MCP1727733.1 ABC-2 type transport system permease protein [Natronospira proteinivora]